jgi:signal peptidase I
MKESLVFLSWVIALLIIVLLLLKILFFDWAVIGNSAMAPTLLREERVLINKRGTPELGQIAVCPNPEQEGFIVGRVVARGAMSIESFGNELKMDKQPVSVEPAGALEFYNPDTDSVQRVRWGTEDFGGKPHRVFFDPEGTFRVRPVELHPGQVYLLGDNRPQRGQDSRAFGPVDEASCIGTIVVRLTAVDGLQGDLQHKALPELL